MFDYIVQFKWDADDVAHMRVEEWAAASSAQQVLVIIIQRFHQIQISGGNDGREAVKTADASVASAGKRSPSRQSSQPQDSFYKVVNFLNGA